ncbi:geranylgeranyl diphosphate synthase [Aspergillus sclerotiicarbonarius CBS 121057]|uniref:Geranylgeranyl diphosphate synthase n=1 Tax=Aspergillus sclerotiicarbonarius (strain CBS 121057 / IBT 28362) TaxID=1448318 RepID=A0A319EK70_ASPSB|nr:geranylgeranyl diphosphate synthase [Aspergillus sclerotiicarbonarius CBS 121057]
MGDPGTPEIILSPLHSPPASIHDSPPLKPTSYPSCLPTTIPALTPSPWTSSKEKTILSPYTYLATQPGKSFRSLLLSAFNQYLQIPEEALTTITNITTMLHTASLLIDDIQDHSLLRRGQPVAHEIFGTAQTINSANYVYFLALREVRKLGSGEAVGVFLDEMENLHRGQGMDLFWRDTSTCPTEAEYLEMALNKTGGLFRLAIRLMQTQSSIPNTNLLPLTNTLGILFQIVDDYRNLCNESYSDKKGFAEDISEGKFSFPVIHSIQADLGNQELVGILKQRTNSDEVKRYAVRYMQRTGSLEYTRGVIRVLVERAREEMGRVDPRGERDGVMGGVLEKMSML